MKKLIVFISVLFSCYYSQSQDLTQGYENAYLEIAEMLQLKQKYSFKRAVFVTENVYYENDLDYQVFDDYILNLVQLTQGFVIANESKFLYDGVDRETILKYASVFKIMTDSIKLLEIGAENVLYHAPYTYDFDDVWGNKDWSQMFVTKLLATNKGNCHSLPYLYKIICEELGVKAHLALAPNHIYIKHKSKKTGMYNTELTSAAFPIDAWLMASGYIHYDAVRNGVYMDTLSNNQSLALCLLDLAKGYEKKFGETDGTFILKCCETSLKYYPNCINALLLKSETLKKQFDKIMLKEKAKYPSDVFHIKEAKDLFDTYEKLTVQIHKLGYRKMPERMYLNWLLELKENKEKYQNKTISAGFKP